jgi:replication initiation protein RepC
VSKPPWGEAFLAIGHEQATNALAVVSTENLALFRTTLGGYFHGLVVKAKADDVNLNPTLWAMQRRRAEAASEDGPRSRVAPAVSTAMGVTSWPGTDGQ